MATVHERRCRLVLYVVDELKTVLAPEPRHGRAWLRM